MIIADLSQGLWHGMIQKFASWWVALGLLGQLLFGSRFILQWVASERKGKSVIPVAFWYLSLGGSAILLIYAIHIADPVFILANFFNGFIYIRNLMLIGKEKRASREA